LSGKVYQSEDVPPEHIATLVTGSYNGREEAVEDYHSTIKWYHDLSTADLNSLFDAEMNVIDSNLTESIERCNRALEYT
jgi:hypothetical protein